MWRRWFFADHATRTISPFESGTIAEYVQRRIAENTLSSLEEAVRLDPTNGVALARLTKAVLPSDLWRSGIESIGMSESLS